MANHPRSRVLPTPGHPGTGLESTREDPTTGARLGAVGRHGCEGAPGTQAFSEETCPCPRWSAPRFRDLRPLAEARRLPGYQPATMVAGGPYGPPGPGSPRAGGRKHRAGKESDRPQGFAPGSDRPWRLGGNANFTSGLEAPERGDPGAPKLPTCPFTLLPQKWAKDGTGFQSFVFTKSEDWSPLFIYSPSML